MHDWGEGGKVGSSVNSKQLSKRLDYALGEQVMFSDEKPQSLKSHVTVLQHNSWAQILQQEFNFLKPIAAGPILYI
jgi:hypothetical protein